MKTIEKVTVSTEANSIEKKPEKRRRGAGRRNNACQTIQGRVIKAVVLFTDGSKLTRYIGQGTGNRLGRPATKKANAHPLNGNASAAADRVRSHLKDQIGQKRVRSWRPSA